MKRSGLLWMVGAAFLGTMAYALAEELILTTYYPSPRGVYQELRVGGGTVPSQPVRLHVESTALADGVTINNTAVGDGDPVLRFQLGGLSPIAINLTVDNEF